MPGTAAGHVVSAFPDFHSELLCPHPTPAAPQLLPPPAFILCEAPLFSLPALSAWGAWEPLIERKD